MSLRLTQIKALVVNLAYRKIAKTNQQSVGSITKRWSNTNPKKVEKVINIILFYKGVPLLFRLLIGIWWQIRSAERSSG